MNHAEFRERVEKCRQPGHCFIKWWGEEEALVAQEREVLSGSLGYFLDDGDALSRHQLDVPLRVLVVEARGGARGEDDLARRDGLWETEIAQQGDNRHARGRPQCAATEEREEVSASDC